MNPENGGNLAIRALFHSDGTTAGIRIDQADPVIRWGSALLDQLTEDVLVGDLLTIRAINGTWVYRIRPREEGAVTVLADLVESPPASYGGRP